MIVGVPGEHLRRWGKAARTGQIGDGNIFVSGFEHAVRVRMGETDAAAAAN